MKPKVTLVDYGSGNVLSVSRALAHCGADVVLTSDHKLIADAERVVLPGVGAFASCMGKLQALNLTDAIAAFVRTERPFLGICVGMQVLFEESEEFGLHQGLGLIPGKVVRVPSTDSSGAPHSIPFIGWSGLVFPESRSNWNGTLLEDIHQGESVYFLHSFMAAPKDPKHRIADSSYDGSVIAAAVMSQNVMGTQFHLEKSGPVGLKIASRFLLL